MKQRQQPNSIERRFYPINLRQAGEGSRKLKGYAAVFERETVLVPADAWYKGSPEIREVIERGAFAKTLTESDVRAVWNHNTDFVLGRKNNGTLKLWEDERGLGNEIDPPDTDLVRDMVIAPIERGDVDQMSFAFRIIREKVEEEDSVITIRLKEVELIEVSPVAIPAYPQTEIALSSRSADRLEEFRQQRQAAIQSAPGQAAAHPEQAEPTQSTPVSEGHPEESAPPDTRHLDEALYMRLDLAKRKIAA